VAALVEEVREVHIGEAIDLVIMEPDHLVGGGSGGYVLGLGDMVTITANRVLL